LSPYLKFYNFKLPSKYKIEILYIFLSQIIIFFIFFLDLIVVDKVTGNYILTQFYLTNFNKQSFLVKKILKLYYLIFINFIKNKKSLYLNNFVNKYL